MHALRNDTKSQNTKDSLDMVTCKMDPPVISSAYNKMPDKYEYTIETVNPNGKIDLKHNEKNASDKKIADDVNQMHDSNDIGLTKRGVKRNVLKLVPEKLPCPRETTRTTDIPFVLNAVIPIQNEMKTSRFEDNPNAGSEISSSTLLIIAICCFNFVFFFT